MKGTYTDPWKTKAQAEKAYEETEEQQVYLRPRLKGRSRTPVFSQKYFFPREDELSQRAKKSWITIRKRQKLIAAGFDPETASLIAKVGKRRANRILKLRAKRRAS